MIRLKEWKLRLVWIIVIYAKKNLRIINLLNFVDFVKKHFANIAYLRQKIFQKVKIIKEEIFVLYAKENILFVIFFKIKT